MKKWGIVSSLVAVSLVSAAVGATAATGLPQIKAYLNTKLNFKLAGDSWLPRDAAGKRIYPVTYNGTTYLPVRAVGEALGVSIGFNGTTKTVLIGDGASTGTATGGTTNTGSTVGYNRTNPAPLGTVLNFKETSLIDYVGKMSVTEIIRGEEAWNMIQAANMFNDEPAAGYEYILAKVNVNITRTVKTGAAADVSRVWFTLVSTGGRDYETVSVVEPEPSIRSSLYEGASHTGWVAFQVKSDDPSPLITFGRKYDGTGGVWFKTTN